MTDFAVWHNRKEIIAELEEAMIHFTSIGNPILGDFICFIVVRAAMFSDGELDSLLQSIHQQSQGE